VDWTVWGLNSGRGKRFSWSQKCLDWLWGLPMLMYNEWQVYIWEGRGVNWPGCEMYHLPPSSAEVENMGSVATPLIPPPHVPS